jgi:hypothetical protein
VSEPVSTDPIGDALRADAEAARAEIRAAGIVCPSCGVNMADLPEGHSLVLTSGGIKQANGTEGPWTAQCASGELIHLSGDVPMTDADFTIWQNAANVNLYDDFRKREAEAFAEIIGTGPANFTGLLDIL